MHFARHAVIVWDSQISHLSMHSVVIRSLSPFPVVISFPISTKCPSIADGDGIGLRVMGTT